MCRRISRSACPLLHFRSCNPFDHQTRVSTLCCVNYLGPTPLLDVFKAKTIIFTEHMLLPYPVEVERIAAAVLVIQAVADT